MKSPQPSGPRASLLCLRRLSLTERQARRAHRGERDRDGGEGRTGGNVAEDRRPKKPVPVAGEADVDVEVEGVEDAEEDVMEDTSDLEDDADAIGPEIEVPTDNDEER